jgi:hypothetical protein
MIEMVTPEADEDARKVQREAVKFLLDPNQQRSQQHFDNMIKGVTGQGEGDSPAANPESRPDDRVQRQATRTSGLGPAYDNAKAQLLQAQQEYTTAQTVYQPNSRGLREAAGKLAQARRALADVASATLGTVQKQLADMKEEYDVYLTEMKPEHPKMQDLSAKIDAGNKAVRQLRADIAQGLEPIYVCNIDERKRIDSEFREDSKPGDGTGKKHTFTAYFMYSYKTRASTDLEVFGDGYGGRISPGDYRDQGACRFFYKPPYLIVYRTDYGTEGVPTAVENPEFLYDQHKQKARPREGTASSVAETIGDVSAARQNPVAAVKVQRLGLTDAASQGVALLFTDAQGKAHEIAIREDGARDFHKDGNMFINSAYCDMTLRCDKQTKTWRVAYQKSVEEDLGRLRPTRESIYRAENEGWTAHDLPPIRFLVFNQKQKTYIFMHRLDLGSEGVPQQHETAEDLFTALPLDKTGGESSFVKWKFNSKTVKEDR